MKKILFIAAMLLCLMNNSIQAQFTVEGTTYSTVKSSTEDTEISTPFTFKVKDMEYPIFLSKNGCAYIKRVSRKGNEYKQYLGSEISRDICAKLNIEYKGK